MKLLGTQRHKLSILDTSGHAEIAWSIEDFDSIKHAKQMFDDLLAKGYQAFSVERDENGASKGEKITKFNPSACELIMVPKVSGG